MNPREQVNELLAQHGAVLLRRKNHEVWQLPNGKQFVRGLTSSDAKADANNGDRQNGGYHWRASAADA